MSNIITNVRTILQDAWQQESNGIWYVSVPFECEENEDIVMEVADPEDYIAEHKADFDALNNGFTRKNECIITSNIKPSCDIHVSINKVSDIGGHIFVDDSGNMEYIPEIAANNFFDLIKGVENE